MPFEVKQQVFSGPLDLLLSLIVEKSLPITDVSLARVAEEYLAYVEKEEVPSDELADFLVVASKLLLLKSDALLPVPQPFEDEQGVPLELQLRLYQEFVRVAKQLESRFGTSVSFARERTKTPLPEGFVAPTTVTTSVLRDHFDALLKRLAPFFSLRQESLIRVASIAEKMEQIKHAVISQARIRFSQLFTKDATRSEAVAGFLALLELVKQRVVDVKQERAFEDILLSQVE